MRILFISKKPKTASWSDSIIQLRENLDSIEGVEVIRFEVDTGGVRRYLSNARRLRSIMDSEKIQLIFVNHVICAWPIFGPLKRFSGKKVLALHETEPVLGYSYLLQNLLRIPIKHWIRYQKFWNSHPLKFFDKVFILNQRQALFPRHKDKYHQVNYLGVDAERFLPSESAEPALNGLFPFGADRIEKGFKLAKGAVERVQGVQLKYGGAIPFTEMPEHYRRSAFLLLPTLYETYSLVLLEAFASNIFVIANRHVGLVENLLEKYSREELLSFGLFVSKRTIDSLVEGVQEIKERIRKGVKPRTRELMEKEGFSGPETAKRVLGEFKKLANGDPS